jgi:ferric-dicitrate binding protein FerR (iron transport regulator)
MTSQARIRLDKRRLIAAEFLVERTSEKQSIGWHTLKWLLWRVNRHNRAEYAALQRMQIEARRLNPLPLPGEDELRGDVSESQHGSLDFSPPPPANARNRSFWRWLAPLPAGLCLIWASFCELRVPADLGTADRTYRTDQGEIRVWTLPDGSRMTLGGRTEALTNFSHGRRSIRLTRGEALFQAQHEPTRPFSVCTLHGCVTDIGTVFDIRVYSDLIRVSVREGTVEVSPGSMSRSPGARAPSDSALSSVRLTRDQELRYRHGSALAPPQQTTESAGITWNQGLLTYRGTSLSEVIEDAQRYSRRPILADPSVATFHYSGSIVEQHVDEWIHGLTTIFPVNVVDCRLSYQKLCNGQPNALVISAIDGR